MALPLWFKDFAYQCEEQAYKIGLKPDEFWGMIPSEFIRYYKGRIEAIKEQDKRDNFRSAMITTMIYNANSKKKKKITDFMPREKKTQTPAEMMKVVRALNKQLGGIEK
jgi:hypothetical protein